ncbi:MAG: ABC transporter ATP-binding protein [Armatimonadetes bacterium]|nr:ABC transporter ATP-binding protein [Armatimonadota bacterium]
MIELVGASRWYGQVIGLNDVTCTIGPGITALLGENGAGKSTMIKMITGQLRPTTGEVRVFGHVPFANRTVLKEIGYCPETDSYYDQMTGRQFVQLMARMSGLHSKAVRDAANSAIENVGMAERADTLIAGYSKGMRQRIKIAQALAHDPKMLIMDEPLNGLDPIGRREMKELLVRLAGEGKTVLISSHILHEVEQMTHSILLLHRGRLLARGDIREIRSLIDRHPHRVRVAMDGARQFAPRLLELPYVLSIQFDRNDPQMFEVQTTEPDRFYSKFAEIVLQDGRRVEEFYSPDNNLEAVFKYLVTG